MKELAILKIQSHRSMGKTEIENTINFEQHTFHIFSDLARPAAFDSAWLIMEFHVTRVFGATQVRNIPHFAYHKYWS